jgi:hypothetical protein
MKIFNGRLATEDYMSTHSLTFSTPEMTLKKFAIWLGEQIKDSKTDTPTPRLLSYLEDKSESKTGMSSPPSRYLPDIDETFKPTGAIADFYSTQQHENASNTKQSGDIETKYCINCGGTIRYSSKFCNKCGYVQE